MQRLLRGAVRLVRGGGQTGRRAERRRFDERSPGRDPVGASARRVALGSGSRITSKKSRGNEIVDLFCILIDWIP